MRRYRAVIAYDGTPYRGFQRQADHTPTVQKALEEALHTITGAHLTIIGAGRTDSGVHATGQVIAFDANWRHPAESLLRALNANLPPSIAVQQIAIAEAGFHPRFDAVSRTYQYHIYNAAVRHPLHARTAWHIARPLDAAAMQEASECLIGEHNFATFGRPPQGENTTRRVRRAVWAKQSEKLVFTIEANAFLYRMVRSIAGTLVQVGSGSQSPEAFANALNAADRARAGNTAPPQGVYLINVKYLE